MNFISLIQERLGLTAYALAKRLGVTQQAVRIWNGTTKKRTKPESMSLTALCKLRKVSGLSWSKFGKMLDGEFLAIDRNDDKESR